MKQVSPKIPFFRALFWIFSSTLLVSGSAAGALFFYNYHNSQRGADPKYTIVALVQTGPEKEQLKTPYLAQLLDLSADKPTNLYHFKTYEAKQKLLASPLIKEAEVKKIAPGTIYVDYVVRKPLAYLGDYENTAIDADGILFPFKPFFTPKRIPELYIGMTKETLAWGQALSGKNAALALDVMGIFKQHYQTTSILLQKVDVSKAFSESYGHRQIVVVMEDPELKASRQVILRLNTENYKEDLKQYLALRETNLLALPKKSTLSAIVIDLRIPNLVFIPK